mgnify:CR=1 FL=1
MNKKYKLEEYIEIINNYIDKVIPECFFGEDVVHQAMKYSLSVGGKRIRPVLTLEFCRLCGGEINKALPFAVAAEMIHTYSLVHDDLPCMDDDDMRRGMPSCHIKFGEEYALLAGDALLTRAFGVLTESEASPEAVVKAVSLLSELSGVSGMIGGQVVDLKNEDRPCTIEVLETMDSLKTGALIKCASLLGVIAAGGNPKQYEAARCFSENLGHAFQIVDDILDVIGDEKELGKPIGSDRESGKSTYVSVLGLEKSQQYAKDITAKAIEALSIFGDDADFLKELAEKLINRKN